MIKLIQKITRCLLIHPKFSPYSFWNFVEVSKIVGAKYQAAPLGLKTVAALLPQEWEIKLIDTNVEPLLDEPTNELDEKSKRDLTKLLLEVTNNKTTFWITHDQTILKYFTCVLLLDEGKIDYIGTPEDFSFYLENKVEEKQIVDQLFPNTNRKEEE